MICRYAFSALSEIFSCIVMLAETGFLICFFTVSFCKSLHLTRAIRPRYCGSVPSEESVPGGDLRKINIRDARAGMMLARDIYSWSGELLLETGNGLDTTRLEMLRREKVAELIIQDRRVDDIVLIPTVPEDIEAEASAYLYRLERSFRGRKAAGINVEVMTADRLVKMMLQALGNTFLGEVNLDGARSADFYDCIHSVRMTVLSLLIGKETGISGRELARLGVASLLADIGYLLVPEPVLASRGRLNELGLKLLRRHALYSRAIIDSSTDSYPEIARAVAEHHERGDGSGYPYGLKNDEISQFAKIIAVADTYHELVSQRPGGKPVLPDKALAFILERAGCEFDRRVVDAFSRVVPVYSRGTPVSMRYGELGVVTRSGIGQVVAPAVRVFYDRYGREPRRATEIDLSEEGMGQAIAALDVFLPEKRDNDTETAAILESTKNVVAENKSSALGKTRIPIFDKARISVSGIQDWQRQPGGAVTGMVPPRKVAMNPEAPQKAMEKPVEVNPEPQTVAAARTAPLPPPPSRPVVPPQRSQAVRHPAAVARPAGSGAVVPGPVRAQGDNNTVVRRRVVRVIRHNIRRTG